uniref:Uncharacterized protein AlNc14C108G6282 n=1 Tax=Albugo laibachii Nc14 TaxID=890382 RepID=F0WI75_9STRA|nr:conserved hypothetical protein [Albugo laibachii Nc14]|eukprot:CCA20954.1 conserved hypothetical protein [Albugo laibachii Nc14]
MILYDVLSTTSFLTITIDWQISPRMPSNHASTCAPWLNWSEWLQVYDYVYSNDVRLSQEGLERIASWRSRCSLPISIESTSQLVEIRLHEQLASNTCSVIGQSARSELELRMMHACVIVRCVNGLVDAMQSKNSIAMAVSALAQRIGIPLWIVDLRHESTHNELPMLPVLRFASSYLLSWLERNYWGKQCAILKDTVHAVMTQWMSSMDRVSESISIKKKSISMNEDHFSPDGISNILIPLLVDGNQYGVAFYGTPFWKYQLSASKLAKKDTITETEKRVFDELLKLQVSWTHFSSALLEQFHNRFVHLMFIEESKEEKSAIQVWISLLVSQEWSIKLKRHGLDAMESVYQSGVQLLVSLNRQCHIAQLSNAPHLPELKQIYKILKACKPIRTHPHRTKLESMQEEIHSFLQQQTQSYKQNHLHQKQVWMHLSFWLPCPLGSLPVLLKFTEHQLDEISGMAPPITADCKQSRDKYPTFESEDEANDAAMSWHDHKYLQEISSILSIRDDLIEETISQQQSGMNGHVLPRKELVRLQTSIAIW